MQRNFPDVSKGFNKLLASITPPEAAPAPTIVCTSSINRIALSRFCNSDSSPLNRFSKSPRYLVPANKAPRSREYTTLSLRMSGTSPSTIFLAKPSTMAVLPTPDSPTNRGLFLRLRAKICASRSTSLRRPISGSMCPASASKFRLVEKLSRGFAPPSSL